MTLSDNTLNADDTKQLIRMNGTAVAAGAATQFSVTSRAPVFAGTAFTITVSALTSSNQAAKSYNGTVSFTSSDPGFVNPGPLTLSNGAGQAVVTLNTLGTQTIKAMDTASSALTGTGSFQVIAVPTALTSPAPGSTLAGASVTFTWTAGTGTTAYGLWLGFNGVGSSDLYTLGSTTATSATVTELQTKGATIYARLFFEIGGIWYHNDYIFTEATSAAATMISPGQGGTLGASGVMFTWTAGTLVTNYDLWLGTSGPGSSDLYSSGLIAATSVTVPSLPADGAKVYARLFSEGSGGVQYVDYTYTEGTSTAATMISPGQGTTLGVSGVMFNWKAGTLVTNYQLWLGVAGPGSSDLYVSPLSQAMSATVPKLPANGVKVYARLYSEGSGGIQYVDYTYFEQ